MIFSSSIATLLCGAGILKGMGYTDSSFSSSKNPTATVAVTVYSGVQPSAATITSSWASYNTTFLFHQPGVTFTQPTWSSATLGGQLPMTASPTAVTAANSGTASWAIIWCNNVAAGTGAGQISNGTIPNASFIVGGVTLATGNGLISVTDTNIVSGTSVSVLGANLGFTL
jgi:hypothetical protein